MTIIVSVTALLLQACTVGLLGVILYKTVLYQVFVSPLSKVPNAHWSSAVNPGWIIWIRKSGLENRALLEHHKRLGPILRTAPMEISICRVEDVRTVYSGNFEKEAWLARCSDNYGVKNMFSMEGLKEHAERKRMLWEPYSKTATLASKELSQISKRLLVTRLLPLLESTVVNDGLLNVVDLSCSWVMDFLTPHLFGVSNGSDLLHDTTLREAFFRSYHIRSLHAFWPMHLPRFIKFCNAVGLRMIPRIADTANQRVEGWCMEMCIAFEASYLASIKNKVRLPAVSSVLRSHLDGVRPKPDTSFQPEAGPSPPSLTKAIASEMLDHCAAGQETAGTALSFCMHQLSLNPSIQNSLEKELRAREDWNPRDLESLPYLHAVILETLRLHHHKPGPPRIVPVTGCVLGNHQHIPPKTRVSALAYVLHRDSAVFLDSEVFLPERWIAAGEQERTRMQQQFWAFGSGDRQCVARHFAIRVMKVLIAAIYSRYKTSIVHDSDLVETSKVYLAGPTGTPLLLRFKNITDDRVISRDSWCDLSETVQA